VASDRCGIIAKGVSSESTLLPYPPENKEQKKGTTINAARWKKQEKRETNERGTTSKERSNANGESGSILSLLLEGKKRRSETKKKPP